MNNTLQSIRKAVLEAPAVRGITIVGIDGPSGAGKSTLAEKLAPLLNAPVIRIDDFVSWYNFAGWWPRFEQQVLDPLLNGLPARYQQRDWEGDEFGESLGPWTTVNWSPVVLIEGVTCTRREGAGRIAFAVWVEADKDERLRRGIERDGESHRALWRRWMEEEDKFFAVDETRLRADLIVPGTWAKWDPLPCSPPIVIKCVLRSKPKRNSAPQGPSSSWRAAEERRGEPVT